MIASGPLCFIDEGFHLGTPLPSCGVIYKSLKLSWEVAYLLCGYPVVFESMGNRPVPFHRLSEETSLPLKAGYSDSYSTSVEMESLSEVNEDRKWDKAYSRCGIRAKRLTCWGFKPRTNVVFCSLIGFLLAVMITLLIYKCANTKITPNDSSNQDIQNNVSSINSTQEHIILEKISSLQHNISYLSSQLDAIRDHIRQISSTTQGDASLSNRLSQLENQFNTLSSQIHNPVNLYKNCKEDTATCSIDPDHSHTDYWRDCPTKSLPLHKEVHTCITHSKSSLSYSLVCLSYRFPSFHSRVGMVHHESTVYVQIRFKRKYGGFNPFREGWKASL